jgi:adenosyl cobinamide kinase/adenosyl cobinamide phosphate guanylyltransferase
MIMQAYGNRTEFLLLDRVDPQKLYNAARNIEVAAWKLSISRDADGRPMLLSNEIGADGVQNLSFEREIGKLIAYQDTIARVVAERTNRTIRFVVQGVALKAFLPI